MRWARDGFGLGSCTRSKRHAPSNGAPIRDPLQPSKQPFFNTPSAKNHQSVHHHHLPPHRLDCVASTTIGRQPKLDYFDNNWVVAIRFLPAAGPQTSPTVPPSATATHPTLFPVTNHHRHQYYRQNQAAWLGTSCMPGSPSPDRRSTKPDAH